MASKIIGYDNGRNRFYFGSEIVRQEQIGRRIADALINGEEFVDFGTVEVTVNYLTEMLRFVAQRGWFWDCWDIGTGDHDFDPNVPTPGYEWAEVSELKQEARKALATANAMRSKGRGRRVDLAEAHESYARDCQRRAGRLLDRNGR